MLCDSGLWALLPALSRYELELNSEQYGLLFGAMGFGSIVATLILPHILNLHDVIVALSYRRRGLSKLLLQKTEEIAIALGCCKLTLEVLEGNLVAQSAYKAFGFNCYELDPKMGKALFWEKKLEHSSST